MNEYHGLILAYKAYPELGNLVTRRTAASLPVCGRYRLIDFALSSLRNAGITDVGIIMQRDYQSLLDHLGGGKAWDMSKRNGGLKMLPPFGLPSFHKGDYSGTMEALISVSSYIKDIPQSHVVLMTGELLANLDLADIIKSHEESGCAITAVCANYEPDIPHHRYIVDSNGIVTQIHFDREGKSEGLPALECFVIDKEVLLSLMDRCKSLDLFRFSKDALTMYMNDGGKISTYVHNTYARMIRNIEGYYDANMNLLIENNRNALFPKDRPVRTKHAEGVSTYYSSDSKAVNCLVADDCIIEGEIENCVIFPGVRIGKGSVVKNSIIMKGSVICENVSLDCVIADKDTKFTSGVTLTGNKSLPIAVPKEAII